MLARLASARYRNGMSESRFSSDDAEAVEAEANRAVLAGQVFRTAMEIRGGDVSSREHLQALSADLIGKVAVGAYRQRTYYYEQDDGFFARTIPMKRAGEQPISSMYRGIIDGVDEVRRSRGRVSLLALGLQPIASDSELSRSYLKLSVAELNHPLGVTRYDVGRRIWLALPDIASFQIDQTAVDAALRAEEGFHAYLRHRFSPEA